MHDHSRHEPAEGRNEQAPQRRELRETFHQARPGIASHNLVHKTRRRPKPDGTERSAKADYSRPEKRYLEVRRAESFLNPNPQSQPAKGASLILRRGNRNAIGGHVYELRAGTQTVKRSEAAKIGRENWLATAATLLSFLIW
jgi:hypothetical protein